MLLFSANNFISKKSGKFLQEILRRIFFDTQIIKKIIEK